MGVVKGVLGAVVGAVGTAGTAVATGIGAAAGALAGAGAGAGVGAGVTAGSVAASTGASVGTAAAALAAPSTTAASTAAISAGLGPGVAATGAGPGAGAALAASAGKLGGLAAAPAAGGAGGTAAAVGTLGSLVSGTSQTSPNTQIPAGLLQQLGGEGSGVSDLKLLANQGAQDLVDPTNVSFGGALESAPVEELVDPSFLDSLKAEFNPFPEDNVFLDKTRSLFGQLAEVNALRGTVEGLTPNKLSERELAALQRARISRSRGSARTGGLFGARSQGAGVRFAPGAPDLFGISPRF